MTLFDGFVDLEQVDRAARYHRLNALDDPFEGHKVVGGYRDELVTTVILGLVRYFNHDCTRASTYSSYVVSCTSIILGNLRPTTNDRDQSCASCYRRDTAPCMIPLLVLA